MATHPDRLEIRLDPNGVAAPAQHIVTLAAQVVGTLLRALTKDDLSLPDMQGDFMGYRFVGIEMDKAERRDTYQNWVLSKGFQELTRGVRSTLEEALLYLSMVEMKPGLTTIAKVEADIAAIRVRASAMRFPKLLESVNSGLREPMAFEPEFRSLQKARNCLEHRGGIVGPSDVETSTDALSLSFPHLKMIYHRGEEEVEVVLGEAIDTHAPDNPFGVGEQVQIYLKRATRTRTYALGEPVQITASDFFEIAMACHLFAADVGAKLPTLPPLEEASTPESKGS